MMMKSRLFNPLTKYFIYERRRQTQGRVFRIVSSRNGDPHLGENGTTEGRMQMLDDNDNQGSRPTFSHESYKRS